MKSIKNLYKIGYGPSSSHTMGPSFAALNFAENYPEADFFKVVLYGSLAKTGKGHGTDRAIEETLKSIKTESKISSTTRTKMEQIPFKMGWLLSCKGMAAISEITNVTTSSFGCISPICRLPISLMPKVSIIYNISVLIIMEIIKSPISIIFLLVYSMQYDLKQKNIYIKIVMWYNLKKRLKGLL